MILEPSAASPQDPFAVEVLHRLPLAESFYTLWAFIATDSVLDSLFDAHRGNGYQDRLTFPELVNVLVDAITRHHGFALPAINAASDNQCLSSKGRAVYAKLSRLPLPLAEAFLSGLTARLNGLFPDSLHRNDIPISLDEFTIVVLDGKKLKNAAKRLMATRGRPGKLFGGKLLAAFLPATGLVVAMSSDPDGDANDIRLVPSVLPQVKEAVKGARLWVADAQFCDLDQTAAFSTGEDHFLLRFTLRNSFEADPNRPAQNGTNHAGQVFWQEWGWMGAATDQRRRYVRRIHVERPGETTVIVITDLMDEVKYPASDLLDVYLMRWQIETVFQEITEVFELRQLIGCSPRATVFQASVCLVIYNLLQEIRGQIASKRPGVKRVDEISTEKIFGQMREELGGLHRVLEVEEWQPWIETPRNVEEMVKWLETRLGGVWSKRWMKAKRRKRKATGEKPKVAKKRGAHTSVHKLLEAAKATKPKAAKAIPPSRE